MMIHLVIWSYCLPPFFQTWALSTLRICPDFSNWWPAISVAVFTGSATSMTGHQLLKSGQMSSVDKASEFFGHLLVWISAHFACMSWALCAAWVWSHAGKSSWKGPQLIRKKWLLTSPPRLHRWHPVKCVLSYRKLPSMCLCNNAKD